MIVNLYKQGAKSFYLDIGIQNGVIQGKAQPALNTSQKKKKIEAKNNNTVFSVNWIQNKLSSFCHLWLLLPSLFQSPRLMFSTLISSSQ
jgi:hypothetical protein